MYWRNGGWNWKALFSLGLGMLAAMMWIDAAYYVPAYTSPLSSATYGADFSWLFGLVVGSVAVSDFVCPNRAQRGDRNGFKRLDARLAASRRSASKRSGYRPRRRSRP